MMARSSTNTKRPWPEVDVLDACAQLCAMGLMRLYTTHFLLRRQLACLLRRLRSRFSRLGVCSGQRAEITESGHRERRVPVYLRSVVPHCGSREFRSSMATETV